MVKNPKVSVVIPTFNRAHLIQDALESVFAQTYKDYEVVVVDDGSTDNTREVLKPYLHRIRYVWQENQGVAAARNRGIFLAKGAYITFLDSDDKWVPEKLKRQVDYLETHPSVSLVYGQMISYSVNRPDEKKMLPQRIVRSFKELIKESDQIPTSTVMVRKRCLEAVGGFNPSFYITEDYELWLRVSRRFQIDYLEGVVAEYRVHSSNVTLDVEKVARGYLQVFEKILSLYGHELDDLKLVKDRTTKFRYRLGTHLLKSNRPKEAKGFIQRALWEDWQLGLIFAKENDPITRKLLLFLKPYVVFLWSLIWSVFAPEETRHKDKNQKTILIVESSSGSGGSAKYLSGLLSSLKGKNFSTKVLAYQKGPFFETLSSNGTPLFYSTFLRYPWFGEKMPYMMKIFLTVFQMLVSIPWACFFITRRKISLVHLNNEVSSHIPLILASWMMGQRMVCHLHGWRPLTRIEKIVGKMIPLFVCVTSRGTSYYKTQLPGSRIVTVRNGVSASPKPENGRPGKRVRSSYHIGDQEICIGMIGRLTEAKGQEVFLKAFARVCSQVPEAKGLIVGGDPDARGTHLEVLQTLAEQLGIRERLHFAGWQKETGPYVDAMDIVVQSSIIPEAFGLVVAEAMAEGKPVVASEVGGVPELIQDHVTGLLVPPKDPERLSKALLELIQNPELSAKIGEAGRNYVLKHFDIRENSRKIVRIYRTFLGDTQFLRPSILTTYPIPQSPLWQKKTFLVAPRSQEKKGLLGWWAFRDWTLAFRLLRIRSKFDVLITGAEREDCLFALLQGILPGRKIPHVMIDCLWKYEANPFRYWVKRVSLQGVARSVDRFVVWSKEECADYAHYFKLPFEKFLFRPHHTTLEGYPIENHMGSYLFAGGDSSRDYQTLIEAVASLEIPTVIVARHTDSLNGNGRHLPPHIEIRTTTPEEFRKVMAESRFVVIPMEEGLLQSAGQQSYLNAMLLQKPVIVTEVKGVVDYVTPGVTGIVIPPGDSKALQEAILRVLADGAEIQNMVKAAYERVQNEFSLDHFVDRILSLGEKASQYGK